MGKFENLVGQKFGRLTVIKENGRSENGCVMWECLCDCGNKHSVSSTHLRRGRVKSCGCLLREAAIEKLNKLDRNRYKDLTDKVFGMLTVVGRAERPNHTKYKYVYWECLCECGNKRIVKSSHLISGTVDSCFRCKLKYNTYDLTGEYGIGYTNKGKEFYFDLEDYDKLKHICWGITKLGYVHGSIKYGTGIFLHRLLFDTDEPCIDHINNNPRDNRKSNLRGCNTSENLRNFKISSNNTSGIKGVSFNKKANKWQAYIGVNMKNIHLGIYSNKLDAIKAREDAEIKYFGEFRYNRKDK